jgi:hypothetical protein
MSKMSKILASAATVVIAGGAGAAGVLTGGAANAATQSCGHSCISLYTQQFGKTFVYDDLGQRETTGTSNILFQASNNDPAEDWTILGLPRSGEHGWHKGHGHAETTETSPTSYVDTVGAYYADGGLVSSQLNAHYSKDIAFELEYTPYGVGTDECAGVATTPGAGTKVSLQPCGASSKTLWVVDVANVQSYEWKSYVPLINGADTNFDNPFVLTYPGGYPTDKPRPQLETEPLVTTSRGGVNDNQEWGVEFGTLR